MPIPKVAWNVIRQNVTQYERFWIAAVMLKANATDEVPDKDPNMKRKGNGVCWSRECTRLNMAAMMAATAIEISCVSM